MTGAALLDQLRAELLAEREKSAALARAVKERDFDLARLQLKIDQLLHRLFGRSSEKLPASHLGLFDEGATPEEIAGTPDDEAAYETTPETRKRRGGRMPLPKDLERRQVVHDVPETERVCSCGCLKERFGEDVSGELDLEPARFFVWEHVRPKYACKRCQEGVVQASLPPRPIEQGRPGPGLLAQALVSKYQDHLPLHRQARIFLRHGIEISKSTLCDWVAEGAAALSPIVKAMTKALLASKVVQADETPIVVLEDHDDRRRRTGWLFVYRAPTGDVVFRYRQTRARDGPREFLKDLQGFLQRDGYQGYGDLSPEIVPVGCWAHARRKRVEAKPSDAARCDEALALTGRLHQVEREAKDLSAEERTALRREKALPVLETIAARLGAWGRDALPRIPLGVAVGYATAQWTTLVRYVEDGDLEIDDNAIERAIRGVAVGRKNWRFAGGAQGAERGATIHSIVESCKAAGVEPFAYLKDVLVRVATTPQSRILELTPRGWKTAREREELAASAS